MLIKGAAPGPHGSVATYLNVFVLAVLDTLTSRMEAIIIGERSSNLKAYLRRLCSIKLCIFSDIISYKMLCQNIFQHCMMITSDMIISNSKFNSSKGLICVNSEKLYKPYSIQLWEPRYNGFNTAMFIKVGISYTCHTYQGKLNKAIIAI